MCLYLLKMVLQLARFFLDLHPPTHLSIKYLLTSVDSGEPCSLLLSLETLNDVQLVA